MLVTSRKWCDIKFVTIIESWWQNWDVCHIYQILMGIKLPKPSITYQNCRQRMFLQPPSSNQRYFSIIFQFWLFDRIYWYRWIRINTAGCYSRMDFVRKFLKGLIYLFRYWIFWELVVAIARWIGWLKYWWYVDEHLGVPLPPLQNH